MKKKTVKRAVALRYDAEHDEAPRVVAGGRGHIAERIVEAARRHGVPLRQDHDLVQLLEGLAPGQQIPPELYRAVAEVLVFVYRLGRDAALR
jgi:flagellar biosynthesis protein